MKSNLISMLKNFALFFNRKFSTFGDRAFFDKKDFEWTKEVESLSSEILEEYQNFSLGKGSTYSMLEISGGKNDLTDKNCWQVVSLIYYGEKVSDSDSFFPNTYKVLKYIPNIKTAFFSVLPPGEILEPHNGPFAGVLRYHLGIVIPNGDCGIRVDKETRSWKAGGSLIFDDSYEHEAWNKTEEQRVVLFIDFLRPLLTRTRRI